MTSIIQSIVSGVRGVFGAPTRAAPAKPKPTMSMSQDDARKSVVVPFALLALARGQLSPAAQTAAEAIRDDQDLAAQDAYYLPLSGLVLKDFVTTAANNHNTVRMSFVGDCKERSKELGEEEIPDSFWNDRWDGTLGDAVNDLSAPKVV